MSPQRKYVLFAEICVTTYVRQSLDDERVRFFADLYTSSASGTIPPIIVTTDNKLVDGRHRIAALKLLEEKGAVCEIVECKDNLDLVMAAIRANVGGSKELKQGDIRQTVINLLYQGFGTKRIIDSLPFPKELSRKFVKDAHINWLRQKLSAASAAVKQRKISVEEAAKEFHVQARSLTTFQKKQLRRQLEEQELSNVGSTKGAITGKYYSMTTRMGNYIKKIMVAYEAAEFSETQVLELMAHITHQARTHANAMEDWKGRIQVQVKTRAPLPNSLPPKKFVVDESRMKA